MATETPLSGLKVVELGGSVAVPYGSWILATMGATVVKIERPGSGDDCRAWAPAWYDGVSSLFLSLNAGKHSVEVDLKNPGECAKLRQFIIDEADIVLQNLRPGQAEQMGLGADDLCAASEKLIYCNSGAFGTEGPLSMQPGYDPLMQAFGGLMSVTGHEGDAPVRVGTSIIDMGTGMWGVMGILAALHTRDKTGKGGRIDTALFETALGWMSYFATTYFAEGKIGKRNGSAGPGIAPYQAYPCSDGYLIIAAANDRMYDLFCDVLKRPDMKTDPRFTSNPIRFENMAVLNEIIDSITKTQPRAHWQAALDKVGIPNAPINNMEESLRHPQTEALNIVQTTDDGRFKLMGMPLKFDGKRPPQPKGSPDLGADNGRFFGDK